MKWGRDPDGNAVSLPWEFWRWHFAEKFGWTLDRVDALTQKDLVEYEHVMDGKLKAREKPVGDKRR